MTPSPTHVCVESATPFRLAEITSMCFSKYDRAVCSCLVEWLYLKFPKHFTLTTSRALFCTWIGGFWFDSLFVAIIYFSISQLALCQVSHLRLQKCQIHLSCYSSQTAHFGINQKIPTTETGSAANNELFFFSWESSAALCVFLHEGLTGLRCSSCEKVAVRQNRQFSPILTIQGMLF